MITQAGMSPTLGNMEYASSYDTLSPSTKTQIENEVRKTVEEGRKRAIDILSSRRKDLDTLANALIQYETLSLDEVNRVLKGEKLPNLTSSRGTGIKLPELVLPPGLAGANPGQGPVGGGGLSPVGSSSDSPPT